MPIKKSVIEAIKARVDIVEIIGLFLPLKKSGAGFKCCSPITGEKTASLSVDPVRQIFNDFSAGGEYKGDVFKFLRLYEKMDFVDAIHFLAGHYGIVVEEERSANYDEQTDRRITRLLAMQEFAREYFESCFWAEDSVGYTYMQLRGFENWLLKKFKVGYSPPGYNHVVKLLREKGFTYDEIIDSGLVNYKQANPAKGEQRRIYDRFHSRITIPVTNFKGNIIGFGARITEDRGKDVPKYLNTSENLIYIKSRTLFGLFQANKAIKELDKAYVLEGYTDVMRWHQIGITNVVSSSGTAFTEEQASILKRYTTNIAVIFDGDRAGLRAAYRAVDVLIIAGLSPTVVILPDDHDPDSLGMQLSRDEILEIIAMNTYDGIDFKIKQLFDRDLSPEQIAKGVHEMVKTLVNYPDLVLADLMTQKIADKIGVDVAILRKEVEKEREKKALLAEANKRQRRWEAAHPDPNRKKTLREIAEDRLKAGNQSISPAPLEKRDQVVKEAPVSTAQLIVWEKQMLRLVIQVLTYSNYSYEWVDYCLHNLKDNLIKGHVLFNFLSELEKYRIAGQQVPKQYFQALPPALQRPIKQAFANPFDLKELDKPGFEAAGAKYYSLGISLRKEAIGHAKDYFDQKLKAEPATSPEHDRLQKVLPMLLAIERSVVEASKKLTF